MARAFAGVPIACYLFCSMHFSIYLEDKEQAKEEDNHYSFYVILFVIGRFSVCYPSLVLSPVFRDKSKVAGTFGVFPKKNRRETLLDKNVIHSHSVDRKKCNR